MPRWYLSLSAYINSKLPSLPARRADLSFSCCSRTCAQTAQVWCVFVTTSYEGSNGASFVFKISNFTRCRLFSHSTFCFLCTSAIIFRKRHNSLHANQQVHGSWLVICSHPKADCNCSSVCYVYVPATHKASDRSILLTSKRIPGALLCTAKMPRMYKIIVVIGVLWYRKTYLSTYSIITLLTVIAVSECRLH